MTAAERATDAALAGAADHRAEQSAWSGNLKTASEFKADPRFEWDTPGDCCSQRAPGEGLGCTRLLGHAGRHIATGMDGVLAAWPGTHEPTLADLDDPAPDDAGQPPALVLPDGWEPAGSTRRSGPYYRAAVLDDSLIDADRDEVQLLHLPDCPLTTGEARALAARLVEAAGIVEQLRAGAR